MSIESGRVGQRICDLAMRSSVTVWPCVQSVRELCKTKP